MYKDKLILTCGRFTPPAGGSTEERLAAAEAHLARLTEECEFLFAELTRTLASLKTAASGEGEVV